MFIVTIVYIIIISIGVFIKNSKLNEFIKRPIAFNIGKYLLGITVILSIFLWL